MGGRRQPIDGFGPYGDGRVIERVVVTGAAGGVGSACVDTFQAAGIHVVGVDVAESSAADVHLQIDIADPGCGEQLAERIGSQPVDGLINNAAVQLNRSAVETSAADFDSVYRVNLRAPLLLGSALKDVLARRRGFIVNVASIHALATSTKVSVYAASKGGLVALTRALAIEWAPEIRVNAVLPGAIETEMLIDGLSRSGSSIEELASRHLLKEVGQPRDIAEAVLFLARNSFATGTSLVVDGGATARLSTE